MKKIVPHCLKPQTIDLEVLEENPDFRSDLLFFIRLTGAYAQAIFWQAFPRSAPARRKKMFETAKRKIEENKRNFRDAILDPKKRHAQTTDLFHKGFFDLLKELEKDDSIKKVFADGLKQEHGIFWRFEEFIAALEVLKEKRDYLEHYEERKSGKQVFAPEKNAKALEALGFLLLPEICNMLEMSARAVKGAEAEKAAGDIYVLFGWCKQERAKSIHLISEERKRSRLDKRKRKALATDADNTRVWLKSYRTLGISPTDYREFQFKRRYFFIGPQNLRALFGELGCPLQMKNRALVYESGAGQKTSFKHDVEPFYLLAVRINAAICRYLDFAPKDKKDNIKDTELRNIRNTLAHNGLFWRIYPEGSPSPSPLTVEEVFSQVLEPLTRGDRSEFCDSIERLLRRENHAVLHTRTVDGHPKTEKIRRWNDERREQVKKSPEGNAVVSNRRAVRKVVAGWMGALQRAGQKKGLPKAGKNAI
ncbi:MAG: hypothetical protein V1721_02770 [Pseudomonadota bacterium]